MRDYVQKIKKIRDHRSFENKETYRNKINTDTQMKKRNKKIECYDSHQNNRTIRKQSKTHDAKRTNLHDTIVQANGNTSLASED